MFAPQFFIAATFIGAKGDYGRHAAQTTDGGLQSAASPATCPSPVPIAPRRKSHCNCLFLYILANRLEKIALFLVSSAWVGDPRACKGAQSSHQRLWGLQDARLSRSMFFISKHTLDVAPPAQGWEVDQVHRLKMRTQTNSSFRFSIVTMWTPASNLLTLCA